MRTIEGILWELASQPNDEHLEAVLQDLGEAEFVGLVHYVSTLDAEQDGNRFVIDLVDRETERRAGKEARA